MRLKLIACKALFRELSYVSALSDNIIDITWMRQGYHNEPEVLHSLLQQEIDAVEAGSDPHSYRIRPEDGRSGDFDAILLGYGLCSNATAGVCARHHRLVIPRAHDCITLFLGSKERYASCFAERGMAAITQSAGSPAASGIPPVGSKTVVCRERTPGSGRPGDTRRWGMTKRPSSICWRRQTV